MSTPPIGVLVMAYGGPNSLDEIEPYLLDVRGGRATRPELVEEIRERYRLIGGRSPIRELTQAQADALDVALNADQASPQFRTYVGMRHWHPYIQAAVERMAADGVRQAVGLVLAPHYSRMSIGAYIKKAEEARASVDAALSLVYIESYHLHPLFLRAVAQRVEAALDKFPAEVRASLPVIFTAHSLPQRILEWEDPYPDQLMATATGVAGLLGLQRWQFAYQSAGATADPWLGPDVGEVVAALAEAGERHILVAPIGFVSDHVEILFDIDVELREQAESLGVHLERTVSLNDAPLFIAALADVVRHHTARL
jgi:protoporphyrin/coproporphyrin ferrochelatase